MGMPLGGYWRLEMRLGRVVGSGNAFFFGVVTGGWECLWGGYWRGAGVE